MDKMINGNKILVEALKNLNINLLELIAETSIWASSDACKQLKNKTGSSTRYPDVRRGRHNETKGEIINGIRIDDNTYANNAIKNAIGLNRKNITEFHTCHIYPSTCYDERYHTKIENLVLIPNSIAQLSDNFEDVRRALQYRSYELYGWYPEEETTPTKPANYPDNWRKPTLVTKNISKDDIQKQNVEVIFEAKKDLYFERENNEIEKVLRKVPRWFKSDRTHINSRILLKFLEILDRGGIVSKEKLRNECSSQMEDFNGNFNQMSQFGKKNHGKVFEVVKDEIQLWEPVSKFILEMYQEYQKEFK